jgi:hypothetical protein
MGIFMYVMPGALMFMMVAIILILPMIEDTPSMCTAKIKKVTEGGAYVVLKGA